MEFINKVKNSVCQAKRTIKFNNGLNYFNGLTYNYTILNNRVNVAYEDGRFTTISKEFFNKVFTKNII